MAKNIRLTGTKDNFYKIMKKLKDLFGDKTGLFRNNMPKAPFLLEKSFIFLRSTENVNSPGELVAELFRETFFQNYYLEIRDNGSRLDPYCIDLLEDDKQKINPFTIGERTVLEIFRGKQKKDRGLEVFSYTPCYPQLMRNAWLRKKHARNIRNHFIGGSIAQALWSKDFTKRKENIENFAECFYSACIGVKSNGNQKKSEFLDALLKFETPSAYNNQEKGYKILEKEEVFGKLSKLILNSKTDIETLEPSNRQIYNISNHISLQENSFDKLPSQILKDFKNILDLEKEIPRVEWINYLSNYLRVATPIWVFSNARITIDLYLLLINIIDNDVSAEDSYKEFLLNFNQRNKGIFICSDTPNSGGEEWVKEYGKSRVLLSLLIYYLEFFFEDGFLNKVIDFEISSEKEEISILNLFESVQKIKGEIVLNVKENGFEKIDEFLKRSAEDYSIYRNPGKSGVTKNMIEFLRVLREPEDGFDPGGLLKPSKKGNKIEGFFVFPQTALIRLFTFLAYSNKKRLPNIQELIDHFDIYGIDFSKSNQARTKLKSELLHLGLLKGSPDAGLEAEITTPF